jgi:hypothetical protein
MNSLCKAAVLVAAAVLFSGSVWAAPGGGKGGGGGNSPPKSDPCTTTQSHFPTIAHLVSAKGKKSDQTQRQIMLASADGSCERVLHTYQSQYTWHSSGQLHVDGSSGFFVWIELGPEDSSGERSYALKVLDFTIGDGNTVTPSGTGPRVLLTAEWNSVAGTGTTLNSMRLTPDGIGLFLTADVIATDSPVHSQVWRCGLQDPCHPEIVLDQAVDGDQVWYFWEVAPSADPDKFYVSMHAYPAIGMFFRIHTVNRQNGVWVVGDMIQENADFTSRLGAHPYDPDRLVWTYQGIQICQVNTDTGQCDIVRTINDANLPNWSRGGTLAQPDNEIASLYFRDLSVSGSGMAVVETNDDNGSVTFVSVPVSGYSGAGVY